MRRLKTHTDARRFLASVIDRLEKDQLDPAKAAKLGYLTQILIRALEGEAVSERLEKIEEAINAIREKTERA